MPERLLIVGLLIGVAFFFPSFLIAFLESKEAFLAVFSFVILLRLFFLPSIKIKKNFFFPVFVIFLVSLVFFLHQRLAGSFISLNFYYIALFMFVLILLNQAENLNPDDDSRLFVIFYSFFVILGLLEFFGVTLFNHPFQGTTLFGNTEFFSSFFSPLSVIVIPFYLASSKNGKLLSLSLLITSVFFYFLLGSRIGFISMFCGYLVFFIAGGISLDFETKKSLKKLFLVFGISFFLAILVIPKLTSHSNVIEKSFQEGGSQNIQVRFVFWKFAFEMFLQNPILGVSPEGFRFNYPSFLDKFLSLNPDKKTLFESGVAGNVHCEPLQFLTEYGFLVFVLVFFLIFRGIIRSFKLLQKATNEEKIRGVASFSIIISFFINSLTGPSFHLFPTTLLTFFLAYRFFKDEEIEIQLPLDKKYLRILFFLIGLIISGQIFLYSLSSHYFYLGSFENDFASREILFKRALDLKPFEPRYSDALANLYLDQGKLDLAADNLSSALKFSNNPGLLFTLGRLKFEQKDYREATKAFIIFSRLQPNSSLAENYLTEILKRTGPAK
ncbi:MAG: O-antigen ligase family protein [Candidatus Riflebacteria bacterium]|nr:O-antigen ligase family protein [Candidatus Riflebacteria bacterium]